MRVLGLISRASADGIDAALVELYGAPPSLDWRLLHHHHVNFGAAVRSEILACTRPETGTVERLCALNVRLGELDAAAALAAIEHAGFLPQQVDLIGNHGQTVCHIPGQAALQLGDAAVIAERTGISVVSNFRVRDMAPGGRGAPVAAYADALLVTHATLARAVQDIGGIPSQTKEALALAILAYGIWHGRPGNLASAAGARASVAGDITPAPMPVLVDMSSLTEGRNPATRDLDTLSTVEMLERINRLDALVPGAITPELPSLARAVDAVAERMRAGGRLVYVGAGTSGRLGVLDASEIPPTFGVPADRVLGLIAGGAAALTRSTEGAEDDAAAGARAVADVNLAESDALVGIAASGRTPYVLGAMGEGKRRGALVISLTCNRPTPMQDLADIAIAPLVGPEAITGSTRLKAGTAQKLVLNMLSTGVMVRLGKTYGNLMVDVQTSNVKLRDRARRIVAEACGLPPDEAGRLLAECSGETKTAIVAALANVSPARARAALEQSGGAVRAALSALSV